MIGGSGGVKAGRDHQWTIERGLLEAQLVMLRGELERRLDAAEEDKLLALEQLRHELSGTAAEQAARHVAKERDERIELLRRQSMRRMLNQDLSAGLMAWVELWSAKVYAMAKLRKVANRLRAPALSAAFSQWADEAYRKRAKSEAQRQRDQNAQLRAERD